MRDSEVFWSQVQCALDARRDPLQDEAVLEGIVEDPELGRQLSAMLDALQNLPRAAPRRFARRIAVAAAASIALLFGAIWFARRLDVAPHAPSSIPERVLSFEWEVGTLSPTRSTSIVVTDRGLTARAEYRDDPLNRTTWTTESTQAKYP